MLTVAIAACGGEGGPSSADQQRARTLLGSLISPMRGFIDHYTGINQDDATIESDAARLDAAATQTATRAAEVTSEDLRTRIRRVCDALHDWTVAARAAIPKRQSPGKEYA